MAGAAVKVWRKANFTNCWELAICENYAVGIAKRPVREAMVRAPVHTAHKATDWAKLWRPSRTDGPAGMGPVTVSVGLSAVGQRALELRMPLRRSIRRVRWAKVAGKWHWH